MLDATRIGRFTSSECWKLMTLGKDKKSFGAPALTYIKEKAIERKLGRSINNENDSRSTLWGKLLEGYVFENHVPLEYEICSRDTIVSEDGISAGTPDLICSDTVGDIKCPWTLKSFAEQVEIIESSNPETFKQEKPEYYWQLVKNSILTKCDFAELIVFVPGESEIDRIMSYSITIDDLHLSEKMKWLNYVSLDELPWLPASSKYLSVNRFRFEVPLDDKVALIDKIWAAEKLLICN